MFASYLLPVLTLLMTGSVTEESYEAGGVRFESCDAAVRYAESLPEPVTVECHLVIRPDAEAGSQAVQARGRTAPPGAGRRLRDYQETREFPLDDRNASGVAFLSDDTVLLTFQNYLQIRSIDGEVLKTIGPVDGDIEGLEYDGDRLIAVDERGSTHLELSLAGMEITPVREDPLPVRGIECVAYDRAEDRVYYGHEASGNVLDENFETLVSLERDLAACTIIDGQFMALASHPWRESAWYSIDMKTWKVVDKKVLPDGDWEGIACRGNRCVLVREASEKSGAAMVMFESSTGKQ